MIIQKVPPIGRKIVPNDSVPDIPAVAFTGKELSIEFYGVSEEENKRPKVSLDGISYRPIEVNELISADTIYIAPSDEPTTTNVTINESEDVVITGDFRNFQREGTAFVISTKGYQRVRFENSYMYLNVESSLAEFLGNSIVNTPTLCIKGTETTYTTTRFITDCNNLKEIDMRNVPAHFAEKVVFGGITFYGMSGMEITILAPKEWENYNGGIAYENIYVQCQNKGVTANFKFYEDNETYKS